jgi:hypothetical protein
VDVTASTGCQKQTPRGICESGPLSINPSLGDNFQEQPTGH